MRGGHGFPEFAGVRRQVGILVERLQRLADAAVTGLLHQAQKGGIGLGDVVVGVHDRHPFAHVLEHAGGNAQLCIGALALGDVLQIADKNGARWGLGLADGQVDGNQAPVLAQPQHLAAVGADGFVGLVGVLLHMGVVLLRQGGGHQHRHIAAQHLVPAVAEDLLRRGVEVLHQPLGVDGDHPMAGGVDHRRQPCVADGHGLPQVAVAQDGAGQSQHHHHQQAHKGHDQGQGLGHQLGLCGGMHGRMLQAQRQHGQVMHAGHGRRQQGCGGGAQHQGPRVGGAWVRRRRCSANAATENTSPVSSDSRNKGPSNRRCPGRSMAAIPL